MTTHDLLPAHGRLTCSKCFGGEAVWGRSQIASGDGWTLDHNPCAWGSSNPKYLLLGFSKGERQSQHILARRHNDIPYAGFRPRLADGLKRLGLLSPDKTIDDLIKPTEEDWGFGSLVRCSAASGGKKSGSIINEAPSARSFLEWRDVCTGQFLSSLPPRLRIVVMLSNDEPYVGSCMNRIATLHPGTKRINDVAYGDGKVTWVHIVHFGGQGFNHMRDWMDFADNKAGRKGRSAFEAVKAALESDVGSRAA